MNHETATEDVRSGTSVERMARSFALFALVAIFGGMFLYDGFIGYPRKNIETVFRQILGKEVPETLPPFTPNADERAAESIQSGAKIESVDQQLGQDYADDGNQRVYFGNGGYLQVEYAAGTVTRAIWTDGPEKSPVDLATQKALGIALGLVALFFFVQFLRVASTRASVTKEGLKLDRGPTIPFQQIMAVKQGAHDGEFEIEWKNPAGDDAHNTETIRLDRYKYARLTQIVDAVCLRAGLPHPSRQQSACMEADS